MIGRYNTWLSKRSRRVWHRQDEKTSSRSHGHRSHLREYPVSICSGQRFLGHTQPFHVTPVQAAREVLHPPEGLIRCRVHADGLLHRRPSPLRRSPTVVERLGRFPAAERNHDHSGDCESATSGEKCGRASGSLFTAAHGRLSRRRLAAQWRSNLSITSIRPLLWSRLWSRNCWRCRRS